MLVQYISLFFIVYCSWLSIKLLRAMIYKSVSVNQGKTCIFMIGRLKAGGLCFVFSLSANVWRWQTSMSSKYKFIIILILFLVYGESLFFLLWKSPKFSFDIIWSYIQCQYGHSMLVYFLSSPTENGKFANYVSG